MNEFFLPSGHDNWLIAHFSAVILMSLIYLVASVAVGVMASRMGRSGAAWFFLALFITPLLAFSLLAVVGRWPGRFPE